MLLVGLSFHDMLRNDTTPSDCAEMKAAYYLVPRANFGDLDGTRLSR